ncbi:MAG: glycosyltransferase [Lachnospiraceae bacterium]|nr:glycosyltransferase [Lachnospiraceae bacterium]
MNVVHISTTDCGGAFRATERINDALVHYGIDSKIIVRTKKSPKSDVCVIIDSPIKSFFSKTKNFMNLILAKGLPIFCDYFGTDISKMIDVQNADVIVLHSVSNFISYKELGKICDLGKPVLYVMHDMSIFTGGCIYDNYCEKYRERCGKCPVLHSNHEKDITYYNQKIKKEIISKSKIKFIAPSRWIAECSKNSSVLKEKDVFIIPNSIDTNIFNIANNKTQIIREFGFKPCKKNILFGATRATENPIKGFKYLCKALEFINLADKRLLIFGNEDNAVKEILPRDLEIHFMGNINDDKKLVQLYNLADVFVAPSRQENYPGTVLEASSCGTPTVAFSIGGMPEIISHRNSGYLAQPFEARDLAFGIQYCVEHSEKMGSKAREHIVENNTYNVIAEKYLAWF